MSNELLSLHFSMMASCVRVIGDAFYPSNIKLTMEILENPEAEDEDVDFGLTKMRFWIDNVFGKSIVFSSNNTLVIAMLVGETGHNRTSNLFTLTPEEPSDPLLASLFQSKMNAFANGAFEIGMVEISSDNMDGMTFKYCGDGSELPTMEEWMGTRTFFEKPWWERDDASSLDVVPSDDTDITITPAWAYNLDFLSGRSPEQGGTIVRPQFRPKIIDGGKTD